MIPQTDLSCQTQSDDSHSWQNQMIHSVRDARELCRLLKLSPEQLNLSEQAARQFPINVPRAFIEQIKPNNPHDPVLLQVLNRAEEDLRPQGFSTDPLDESNYRVAPGLIHKYRGRALMLVSSKCAIHCRYCFRRSFPYAENNPGRRQWQQAFDYIDKDSSLTEIIFSGGDPLSAADRQLSWLTEQLDQIPHLKRLRIHTRLPVVIPERICDALLDWIANTRLRVQMVLHINHPNEISPRLEAAVKRLRPLGIQPLNQSVLLRDINDNLKTLKELQEKSFDAGILPYYLHLPDPVEGASHFDVSTDRAKQLVTQLRAELPGYLVPRLAVELPGKPNKTILC